MSPLASIGVRFGLKIVLYSHATKQELTDYRSGIGSESELYSGKHRKYPDTNGNVK